MIANVQTLRDAAKGFNAIIQETWDKLTPQVEPIEAIATEVPSSGPSESYEWLSDWPQLREWIGARVVKSLAAHEYTLKNKKWESTIAVKKEDIEDDRMGVYSPRLRMMAQGRKAYAKLICEILEGGFSGLCYDGQYFFDPDHPTASSTQSNTSSLALDAANAKTAITAMENLTDDLGEPLGISPNICLVGPKKKWAAKTIFEAEKDSYGATNIMKDVAKVVVAPWIITSHWFLFDTTQGVNPLFLQIRKKIIFQMLLGSTESDVDGIEALDSEVFKNDQFLFGLRGRHNAGYGLWQLAYGSNASS